RGWAMDPTWTVTGSADHDGDGRDDIYWQQNGQDHAWLMNGNTIRNMITVAGPPSGDPTPAPDPTPDPDPTPTGDIPELAGYTIEITGDFNGDGQLDALYRRDGAAQTSIRLFDGNGNRIDAGRGWAMDPTWTVTGSADHDGDGNDDIFWQQNGQNHVWLLNGTTIRNMVAVDAPPSGQPTPNPDPTPDPDPDPTPIGEIPELAGYTIETTGDFNGDGELDALYRRDGAAQTSVRLFSNGQLMSSDRGWAMDPTWTVTGSADHDGDGRDDIYWQQNGQDHAWLMNGNTIRNMITVAGPPSGDPTPTPDPTPDLDPEPTAPANHTLVATADFDGDGDNDQLFRNGSDSSTMLLEFEDGSAVTLHDLRTVSNNWEIVDVADFDEDGSTDLLWLSNSGSVAFWFMDGPNEDFQRTNPNRVDTSWTYERSEDADGDGDLDLIWNDGGTETAWLLNGTTVMEVTTTFGEPATDPTPDPGPTEPGNGFTLSATGDFDGDGDDDRLYRNVGASATLIWLMQNGQQVQSAQQIAVGSSWTVTGVEDANDDGTEDVLWASTSGKTAVWYMDGTEIELQVNPA
ncbi:MAG: VCBS repeat-containing protein, partial [Planctomycetota bacterium]